MNTAMTHTLQIGNALRRRAGTAALAAMLIAAASHSWAQPAASAQELVTSRTLQATPPPPSQPAAIAEGEDMRPFFKEDIWRDPDRGFFFAPDPRDVAQPKKPEPPKPMAAPKPKRFEEFTTAKEVQAEHDRLRDQAILRPSEQNVLDYHRFKTAMISQSEKFAAVSQRVIWNNPDIDYNAERASAGFANSNVVDKTIDFESDLVKQYAANYGVLFFFRSDCGYCHEQVPVLGELQRKFGMEVLGVSLDGKPIPNVRKWMPDNGVSMRVSGGKGVKSTPSLYLVSKDQSDVVFLGSGVIAMDEIGYRLRLQTMKRAEDVYRPAMSDPRLVNSQYKAAGRVSPPQR